MPTPAGTKRRPFPERYPVEKLPGEPYEAFVARKRSEFLALANERRRRLKILRRALKVGAINDVELLKGNLPEFEPVIAPWQIETLLRACQGIGKQRSHDILETARLSPRKAVHRLTYRQRQELAGLVVEARTVWAKQ